MYINFVQEREREHACVCVGESKYVGKQFAFCTDSEDFFHLFQISCAFEQQPKTQRAVK